MGCTLSSEERAAFQQSKEIDEKLKQELEMEKNTKEAEILLIGTRFCGKSSLLKQIKTIFKVTDDSNEHTCHKNRTFTVQFTSKDVHFKILDLSPEILSSRKISHFFERVKAIIFIVGICNYDQLVDENPSKTILTECMDLFQTICNNKYLQDPLLFLIFSKKDLFEEKIKQVPLNDFFPEFIGPNSYEETAIFIQRKFESDINNTDREIYSHFVNTADIDNIRLLTEVITDMLMNAYWREIHHCFHLM